MNFRSLGFSLAFAFALSSAALVSAGQPAEGEKKADGCCDDKTSTATVDSAKGDEAAVKGACPMGMSAKAALTATGKCPVAKGAATKSGDATAEAAEVKELGNTKCPITGDAVGAMQKGAHVDYAGVRVGLCCKGCEKKFLQDAEAGLAKAKESVPKS